MKMQVPELQKALKERGLDSKGLKAVLVERLKAALDSSAAGTGADGSGSSGPGSAASAPLQQTRRHSVNKTLIHKEILLEAQIGRHAKLSLSAAMKDRMSESHAEAYRDAQPVAPFLGRYVNSQDQDGLH